MKKFIITSNIFFLVPIVAAFLTQERIFFFLALAAGVVSPIFHYLFEFRSDTLFCTMIRVLDWCIGITCFGYMFYYIFTKDSFTLRAPLALGLSAALIFFWYGLRSSNYKKLHPWFHVITPLLATVIIVSK